MDKLIFEKVWEDEVEDFYEIGVKASSRLISASVRSYTTSAAVSALAKGLENFPESFEDRFFWESGVKGDKFTPYFSLEFWCGDKMGHIVCEVYMEIDDGGPYEKHNCRFYVETEIGLLNSFGKSLPKLNEKGVGQRAELNI